MIPGAPLPSQLAAANAQARITRLGLPTRAKRASAASLHDAEKFLPQRRRRTRDAGSSPRFNSA